jgi:hypothetical protein
VNEANTAIPFLEEYTVLVSYVLLFDAISCGKNERCAAMVRYLALLKARRASATDPEVAGS